VSRMDREQAVVPGLREEVAVESLIAEARGQVEVW
jgi:hypothetical protein